jgi:hypothetical protein
LSSTFWPSARRAAEWAGFASRGRSALVVVPLALIALAAGTPAPAVAGIGAALLILTIGLGWRNAQGPPSAFRQPPTAQALNT